MKEQLTDRKGGRDPIVDPDRAPIEIPCLPFLTPYKLATDHDALSFFRNGIANRRVG